MTIKLLQHKDWLFYKQIRLEALLSDPLAFGSTYEKELQYGEKQWKERVFDARNSIYILFDRLRPVGMLGIHMVDTIAHLWGMYVDKNYRGKGLGKKLLETVLEKAKSIPSATVARLDVNPEQKAAVALYVSLGFVEKTKRMHLMGDNNEHELLVMDIPLH